MKQSFEKIKKNQFYFLSALFITGRLFDIITTALFTPNLDREANPIVSLLGANWTIIILLQITFCAFIIYGLYLHYKTEIKQPTIPNLRFHEYISQLNFNHSNSFHKKFYTIPKNKTFFIVHTGFVLTQTLIISSFLVGLSTSFLLTSTSYRAFYNHGMVYFIYSGMIGLAIYFSIQFYRKSYHEYQLNNK